jgi:hypothetical protein
MHPPMQVLKVALQILPVGVPRHAVYARGRRRAQRPVRLAEAIDRDVMQQRGEPRVPVRLRHMTHAIKRTWRAEPGTVSGARFACRVSLGRSPSLHHFRSRLPGLVRRLRRYYTTV